MGPVRKWGPGPFPVVVVHGGPGAPGEVAPIARELSTVKSVLEPFQSGTTLEEQVCELRSVLLEYGKIPVTLVGFSWGAFLSWIVTARHPELVGKLILVGSPPFEDKYSASVTKFRLNRLKSQERIEAQTLMKDLENPSVVDKNAIMSRLGSLLARTDAFDPMPSEDSVFPCQYDIFRGVWDDASELRRNSTLLLMARSIACPVVAIHGDWDPHPAEGVSVPLFRELVNFRFVLLEKCGHRPWIERNASEQFFKVLAGEL
jgi:pimeloyl-ACP methyl ester carboxylesterase